MAIGLEFSNVIARKEAVADVWPGGLDAFALDQPNYAEDEALCRVGFMSTHEAGALVEHLGAIGVPASSVALIQHNTPAPAWLTFQETPDGNAAWLTGEPPGQVVRPFAALMAEGPADLIDRLRAWCERAGIDTEPAPRSVLGGDETIRFRDGDALIDVDVFVATEQRCRLWGERERSSRRHLAADNALRDRLIDALSELDAHRL
jgi:hypothetical protein